VAGLSGGHETKVSVGSSTKAIWKDRIREGAWGKKLQEAMRGVNSKGGPKYKLFTFLN
jgi:hypothetical protein